MLGYPEIILRLLAAAVLCGALGVEREVYHKPAGLRTHILVGLGSAVLMILSIMLVRMDEGGISVDASRIAAGVITGIGFIGAGTIIRSGEGVTGLTTAASIWTASAIGLAAGAGYYFLAFMGTLLAVAVLFLDHLIIKRRAESVAARKLRPRRVKKQRAAREDF